MAIWANYQRIFYQSGILDFRSFPTLPVIYYMQLAAYSFYALIGNLGFNDPLLFFHTTYVVEGVFLKLPMIIADVGVFFLLARSTKCLAAALYFLNPFMIYLSAAWGTYDSVMIIFLVAGFLALERNNEKLATVAFSISGLVKLFGFLPLVLIVGESLMRRRIKESFLQLGIAGSIASVTLAPIVMQGGQQNFISGFILRFLGVSGAQTRNYSIFSALLGTSFGGAPPYIWIAVIIVALTFLVTIRRTSSLFVPVLLSSTLGAIFLNIFSQSEPQWLSWPIPLALMYASITKRVGLASYAYAFGAIATFLTMTLTQGTGYVLFGLPLAFFLGPLEGFAGAIAVYAVTTLCLLLLLTGYVLSKPVKFKLEVLALIVVVYTQAYFWLAIVGIQNT